MRGSEAIEEVEEGDRRVDASDREGEECHTQKCEQRWRDRGPPGRCWSRGRRSQSRHEGGRGDHTFLIVMTSL